MRDDAKIVDIHLEPNRSGSAAILALEFDKKAEVGGQRVKFIGFELDERNLDQLMLAIVKVAKLRGQNTLAI